MHSGKWAEMKSTQRKKLRTRSEALSAIWRRDTEDKAKMVVGVNVSGQRKSAPVGQLDVWIPIKTLAQVLGVSEDQAGEMLGKLLIAEHLIEDLAVLWIQ
jgi:hypothetical protein